MRLEERYFTMSDGVRLYTRIVLPEADKKFPIVFIRQPYEEKRNGEPYPQDAYRDDLFLENGYAIILQHPRGRGDSEGNCTPYHERQDGLDSLEIIRTLPFYNGEIYVTGESYLSTVHLCYLETNPTDIKAAALSIQTDRMYYRNYRNGCCYDFCNAMWWMHMIKNRYPEQNLSAEVFCRPYEEIAKRVLGEDFPEFTACLLNDTYNEFWKNQEQTNVAERLRIPTLFTEGWYDFYIEGMFSMWERLPKETQKQSVYVVGPWGHATEVSQAAEYPLANGNIPKDWIVKFFNHIRDGADYTEFEIGTVNYYTIGGDFWRTQPQKTTEKKLYFQSHGKLGESAKTSSMQSFTYNPEEKPGCFRYHDIFRAEPAGSVENVLSFVSEPFLEDTDIYGKIRWRMKVKSDCEDTAFFMRVYFVEDGVSYNLTETITTLLHCDENYTKGAECLIDIVTPMIGFRVRRGNSVRVDISSHSDKYVPHANVLGHWAKVTKTKTAVNTVICDEDSYIGLPICTKSFQV